MVDLGYRSRLPDIACVLGMSQFDGSSQSTAAPNRGAIHGASSSDPGLVAPIVREDVNPAWHLYPIRLDLGHADRDAGRCSRRCVRKTSASPCTISPCT